MKMSSHSIQKLFKSVILAIIFGKSGVMVAQDAVPQAPRSTLEVPPLAPMQLREDGTKEFNLTMQKGEKAFLRGKTSQTMGFNGSYLGPTIRVQRGDKVKMHITNQIGEESTVHWHGLHVPAIMDGGPHQPIPASGTWEPEFTIMQQAATLWYHPHPHGKTGEQVYRGLAGLFLIDDPEASALEIPKTYGVDDMPLVIQDRRFNDKGDMEYATSMHDIMMGMMGNAILVNGNINPHWDHAPAKLVHLRFLNGSNARPYNLGFGDNRIFYQIATDGGLMEKPVALKRLLLAAGERAEVLVDLSGDAGKEIEIRGYKLTKPAPADQAEIPTDDQGFLIMTLHPEAGNFAAQKIPDQLVKIEKINPETAVKNRSMVINMDSRGYTINGKVMDHHRIDEVIHLGDTEIWTVEVAEMMMHPFHIHDAQFQVIERGGQAPFVTEQGWKDTVLILPGEKVKFITRFTDFADAEHPYMYHCHILEHEDKGMMGQFIVTP